MDRHRCLLQIKEEKGGGAQRNQLPIHPVILSYTLVYINNMNVIVIVSDEALSLFLLVPISCVVVPVKLHLKC